MRIIPQTMHTDFSTFLFFNAATALLLIIFDGKSFKSYSQGGGKLTSTKSERRGENEQRLARAARLLLELPSLSAKIASTLVLLLNYSWVHLSFSIQMCILLAQTSKYLID